MNIMEWIKGTKINTEKAGDIQYSDLTVTIDRVGGDDFIVKANGIPISNGKEFKVYKGDRLTVEMPKIMPIKLRLVEVQEDDG